MNLQTRIHRRQCLVATLWPLGMAASGAALAQAPESLPAVRSLAEALARALAQREPLLVMVSLNGCAFCHEARQSYLLPLLRAGQPVVQVDMRSARAIVDFSGDDTTHDALVRVWRIRLAPTVLFFGPNGREVAERMKGAYVPDFYGSYLDQRLATAREQVRASG